MNWGMRVDNQEENRAGTNLGMSVKDQASAWKYPEKKKYAEFLLARA